MCLLTAPEGLVIACCSRHKRQRLEGCVQAAEIADRLHLLPPIMDQCEYNLLKRDRVRLYTTAAPLGVAQAAYWPLQPQHGLQVASMPL